jgi:hypothetical protein
MRASRSCCSAVEARAGVGALSDDGYADEDAYGVRKSVGER